MLPASVAAKGLGNVLHGGSPTAQVTVQCAIEWDGYDFRCDVTATVDPDVVLQVMTGGYPFALAWQKTSAKASAPSVVLEHLNPDGLEYSNFVYGNDMWGYGPPFGYVQVQVGYWYYDYSLEHEVLVVLASGTAKCQRGSLLFEE